MGIILSFFVDLRLFKVYNGEKKGEGHYDK